MINIVYMFTADMGTMPIVYCAEGHVILDATVSPMRVKDGLNLFVHADDPRQLTFMDKNGQKAVWTADGETHVDLTADIELFGDESE